MTWLKKNWRKLIVGGCGVAGAGALFVPVLVPVAAVCALAVPVVLAGGSALDALKAASKAPVVKAQRDKLFDKIDGQ